MTGVACEFVGGPRDGEIVVMPDAQYEIRIARPRFDPPCLVSLGELPDMLTLDYGIYRRGRRHRRNGVIIGGDYFWMGWVSDDE